MGRNGFKRQLAMDEPETNRCVAVIGLGSMGFGIAASLLRAGFDVAGSDPNPTVTERLRALGGRVANSPAEAAAGAKAVLCVVVNAAQTEQVLFGPGGCAGQMIPGAAFVAMATIAPDQARSFAAKLAATGADYLDAPISGGAAKAAAGKLSIMASGSPEVFDRVADVLAAVSENLFRLGNQAGQGSTFKIVNQLLAGVHIAVAAEAMAFAAGQGLDLEEVYRVITASAGNSWMFTDRMRRVLDKDRVPRSTTDIFVKDLGIVLDVARAERLPVPISAAALQMFLMASAAGMGAEDDSSVARLYGRLIGSTALDPES
jgi:L-threonate 2-dehydrogenase